MAISQSLDIIFDQEQNALISNVTSLAKSSVIPSIYAYGDTVLNYKIVDGAVNKDLSSATDFEFKIGKFSADALLTSSTFSNANASTGEISVEFDGNVSALQTDLDTSVRKNYYAQISCTNNVSNATSMVCSHVLSVGNIIS